MSARPDYPFADLVAAVEEAFAECPHMPVTDADLYAMYRGTVIRLTEWQRERSDAGEAVDTKLRDLLRPLLDLTRALRNADEEHRPAIRRELRRAYRDVAEHEKRILPVDERWGP